MSKKARDDWISVLGSFQSYSILHLESVCKSQEVAIISQHFSVHPRNSNNQFKWFAVLRNNTDYFLLVFREAIAQRQKSTDVSPAYYTSVFFRENLSLLLFSELFFLLCFVLPSIGPWDYTGAATLFLLNLTVTFFLLMQFTVLGYDLNSLHEFFIVYLNCLWPRQCWCRQNQSEWPGKNQTPRFYLDTTILTKP